MGMHAMVSGVEVKYNRGLDQAMRAIRGVDRDHYVAVDGIVIITREEASEAVNWLFANEHYEMMGYIISWLEMRTGRDLVFV